MRGSPLAINRVLSAPIRVVRHTPVSSKRSGLKALRQANQSRTARVSKAPRLAAGSISACGCGTSRNSTSTPSAAPELAPNTSGLAMGLPVRRCTNRPAMASMAPAASAPNTRGNRQCSSPSSAHCHPYSPLAKNTAGISSMISNPATSRIGRHGCSVGRPRLVLCGWIPPLRWRASSQSSSGTLNTAVRMPAGTSPTRRDSSRAH